LKPPCMIVVRYVLPAIRALMIRDMVEKYNLRKIDASAKMSVTPAAVTQYLKGERGSAFVKEISRSERAMRIVSELAEALVKNDAPIDTAISKLCEICAILRSERKICELHQKELPALKERGCILCEHLKC